jgi:hypothetical protein
MTLSSISIPRNTLLILLCLLSLSGGLQVYAQQPAAAPQPVQQQPQQQPAPAAAADEVERPLSSDGVPSVALFYWLTPSRPAMRTGKAAIENSSANLTFPREQIYAPGAMVSLPAGGLHTLRVSYFRTRGQGNTNAGENLAIFGVGYAANDYLSIGYTLENAKLSLDYLSWPFPVRGSQRFRVKTLWEVQYTSISTRLDAPLKPIQDENGDPIFNDGQGKSWFIYPTLGMGVQHLVTKGFRWEAKGSGFGLPGRAAIWDADAHLAYRHGKFEVMVGAKAFHFKTSPKQELYLRNTLSGGYVGLRWYP